METYPLEVLVEKHGRERVAEMVGCHITNINHVLNNDRKVHVVLGENLEFIQSFEVRPFPNRNISRAKKQKTSAIASN